MTVGIETLTYTPDDIDPLINLLYRVALGNVERWIVNKKQSSRLRESNLGHVNRMLNLVDEIVKDFPILAEPLDIKALKEIIYIHDAGEILIGDDALANKNHEANRPRRWHRENAAVRLLTREYISYPSLKQRLRDTYARYENCRPERKIELDDREALFAHFIDKVQGSRFGLEHVFKDEKDCERTVKRLLEFAIPLFRATPEDGKPDCVRFVTQELRKFGDYGFTRVSRDAQSEFLKRILNLSGKVL